MPAHTLKCALQGNQSGTRSWVGWAPQLSVSTRAAVRARVVICPSLWPRWPGFDWQQGFSQGVLHILLSRWRATLQIKCTHQQIWLQCLISALITGSVLWLSTTKESSFVCWDWVNISELRIKILRGRRTPSWWGHVFPCWRRIKSHLDGVLQQLCVPLIFLCLLCQPFFFFFKNLQSRLFKAKKRTKCTLAF